MLKKEIVVLLKSSKNLIEASHVLIFLVWSQERYMVSEVGVYNSEREVQQDLTRV